MRVSLRYRLLVPLAVILLGDAIATGWAAVHAAHSADRRVAAQVHSVALVLTEPPAFPLTDPVLRQMKRLSGAEFLFASKGSVRVSTLPDAASISLPPDPPEPPDLLSRDPDLGPPVTVAGIEFRVLKLRLAAPHPNEGGTLYIFYPEELRQTAVWDAVRPPLLLGGVGGLVAGLLTVVVSGRIVGRIRAVDDRTRAIAAGDFRPMALPRTEDELRDLCESVNEMARRLAEYRDVLQQTERLRVIGQFSGGLAHQLRNAAAGAKLAVQLHAADCTSEDREPLEVALRQLDRSERMIRQFLALGQEPTADRSSCDLGEIVSRTVALMAPQCRHAGTEVLWVPPASTITISGIADPLDHLITNLIANAVEAAGAGGTVEVNLSREATGIRLAVYDTGPGPPAEIADRLFDPFVTGKAQGIGLGLAIASQAVALHEGKLTWHRERDRTAFVVEFKG